VDWFPYTQWARLLPAASEIPPGSTQVIRGDRSSSSSGGMGRSGDVPDAKHSGLARGLGMDSMGDMPVLETASRFSNYQQ
jgi:hypothetical protein